MAEESAVLNRLKFISRLSVLATLLLTLALGLFVVSASGVVEEHARSMGSAVEAFATVRFWVTVAAGLLGLSLLSIAKEPLLQSVTLRLILNIVHLFLIASVLLFWSWAVMAQLASFL